MVALTGAGCSTESGIPDYRGPETARRARNPIQYRDFVSSERGRQRYWARSVIGWDRFRRALPSRAHTALAALERQNFVGVITQNVDRLHSAAGSRDVVELHGALAEVRCLSCGALSPRDELQSRLLDLNPGWLDRAAPELAPDGDAELNPGDSAGFRVASCEACGGVLKPNVVFFGEGVPKPVVDAAWRLFAQAEVLLVAGSSLVVFSGFRFVRRAVEQNKAIAIVNYGETRGHPFADVTVDASVGDVLERLLQLQSSTEAIADR